MFLSAPPFWISLFLTFGLGLEAVLAQDDKIIPASLRPADGLTIQLYATGVEGARSMTRDVDGTVYVGTRDQGRVYALRDHDQDGRAEDVRVLVDGLQLPNGVAMVDGDLYIAEMSRLVRISRQALKTQQKPAVEVVRDGFPAEIHHGWRAVKLGPDGWLYLALGVPCNSCEPRAPLEGRLVRIHPRTGALEILAEGLRNSVGLAFEPGSGTLWLTDNGRDYLGDDLPPDELNRYDGQPRHYGFPGCYGAAVPDPRWGSTKACQSQTPPAWEFPAHVAPVGLLFYEGQSLPESFRGQLLVAQHGSWNRSEPQGYRLVALRLEDGRVVSERVMVSGWLKDGHEILGRPVDLLMLPDGSVLVSDDFADVIYRITGASSTP